MVHRVNGETQVDVFVNGTAPVSHHRGHFQTTLCLAPCHACEPALNRSIRARSFGSPGEPAGPQVFVPWSRLGVPAYSKNFRLHPVLVLSPGTLARL